MFTKLYLNFGTMYTEFVLFFCVDKLCRIIDYYLLLCYNYIITQFLYEEICPSSVVIELGNPKKNKWKKFSEESLKNICKKQRNTFSNLVSTIKFLYKARISDDGIKTIVKNSNDQFSLLKKLIWLFARYLLVALEISAVRFKIFKMMFEDYATDFNDYEFESLLNHTDNWWLDDSHIKIHLLIDYCDFLFIDSIVCKEICKTINCSGDNYHNYRKEIITIMREIENQRFDEYAESKISDFNKTRGKIKKPRINNAQESAKLYELNYNDISLLSDEERK